MNELLGKIFITGLWCLIPSAISAIIAESMRECLESTHASNGWFIAASVFFSPIVVCLCFSAVLKILKVWGISW